MESNCQIKEKQSFRVNWIAKISILKCHSTVFRQKAVLAFLWVVEKPGGNWCLPPLKKNTTEEDDEEIEEAAKISADAAVAAVLAELGGTSVV